MEPEATEATELVELRLALVVLTHALSERSPERCGAVLDAAARTAARTGRQELSALGAARAGHIATRFGAARALHTLCGACGLCPRGAPAKAEKLMAATPAPPAA